MVLGLHAVAEPCGGWSLSRNCSMATGPHAPKPVVFSVAQICNLPYRRIAFCGVGNCQHARIFGRSADYKSAIQQITNLRYEVVSHSARLACTKSVHCR